MNQIITNNQTNRHIKSRASLNQYLKSFLSQRLRILTIIDFSSYTRVGETGEERLSLKRNGKVIQPLSFKRLANIENASAY